MQYNKSLIPQDAGELYWSWPNIQQTWDQPQTYNGGMFLIGLLYMAAMDSKPLDANQVDSFEVDAGVG